jgi:predicted dehydrogenase
MIGAGELGRVYFIHHRGTNRRGRAGMEYNPDAPWFVDRSKAGGGPMTDWGGYDFAFHLGLVGDPAFVRAEAFCVNGLDRMESRPDSFTIEEHGATMMQFEDGLRYYWERGGNAHCEVPHETIIHGTKGALKLSYCPWDSMDIEHYWVADDGRGEAGSSTITLENTWEPGPGDTAAMAEAFVARILDGAPLPISPEQEVVNLKIVEAVYAAAGW